MSVNLLIGKAKEPNAQNRDRRLPGLVSRDRLIRVMACPIQFNGQLHLRAIKIQHIVVNAVLPAKLTVFDLAIAQALPNQLFRFGRLFETDLDSRKWTGSLSGLQTL